MPTLPYPNAADVKVFSNEYINVNTMNRALMRLFYNDDYLANLASLDPVDAPTVANMLLVSTGPSTYTWKTDTQVKSLLNISDSIFGMADIDDNASNMLDGYGMVWDASKDAFIGRKGASQLTDLEDVTITSPIDLHSIFYSAEYGAFINGFPDDFTVGYVQHVTLEVDTKVLLPAVSSVGKQIVITKIGTGTDVYVVPDASNAINGQSAKSILITSSSEEVATIQIRSIAKADESIEWIILAGDGTMEIIDSALVPGASIDIRTILDEDLMLAPYDLQIDSVPDASTLTKGIVRLATATEAQLGTATDIAMTPWGVKYWVENYTIPFTSDVDFDTGTATDEVASVKQIVDADTRIIEKYSPAFYSVKVNSAHNLTLPSEFVTNIAEYDLYSRGSIQTGHNNYAHPSINSLLYTMNIEVLATTTLEFNLFQIDDAIYIYIDGVLQTSRDSAGSWIDPPLSLSFALNAGTYLLQIVKNDAGGGANQIDLCAKVIGENVNFVNPY